MLDRTETCNICWLAINLFTRQVFIGCKLSTVLELALHMCLCDLERGFAHFSSNCDNFFF
jgi:hypothetical protein